MQTKLTLRLDLSVIRRAKQYARRTGKSLSSIVSDYFSSLSDASEIRRVSAPKVRSLVGMLKGSSLDEGDYRRHLAKKHR